MQNILSKFNIQSGDALSHMLEALLAVAAVIVLVVIIKKLFSKLEKKAAERGDETIYLHIVGKVLVVLTLIIGGGAVFSSIPAVRTIFSSLLASSGVAALVISLAAQDAVGNLVGGFMINISKPFKVGDTIRFIDKGTTGVVEKITMRHTVIRTSENKYVIVPNGTLNSSVIENITYGGEICVSMEISISYTSDIPRAMELFAEAVFQQPNFVDKRSKTEIESNVFPVQVTVSELNVSDVKLKTSFWTADIASGNQFKSNVYLTMLQKIENENVDFAYPRITVSEAK